MTDFTPDDDRGAGVVAQADGKIVAAGWAADNLGYRPARPTRFALARYNQDGTLDPTFSGDGKATTELSGGHASGIAVQDDRKIVVAAGGEPGPDTGFALVRYNANGTLDTSLGEAG
jgi:uncharacterized delta-60 repeat protein